MVIGRSKSRPANLVLANPEAWTAGSPLKRHDTDFHSLVDDVRALQAHPSGLRVQICLTEVTTPLERWRL